MKKIDFFALKFVFLHMNYLDIILAIPLAFAAWKGFQKGFIIEIFTLMAFFVGMYAGIHFSDSTATFIKEKWEVNSIYLPSISFTVTFLIVGAAVFFAGKAIEQVVKITALSSMNKMGGLVFGTLKMLLIVSVLLSLVESYSEKNELLSEETREASFLYKPVKALSLYTVPGLKSSNIFIQNALKPESDSTGMQPKEIMRANEMADSLGIVVKDAKQLIEIHEKDK
jgi:membrane protein required for colicin V production